MARALAQPTSRARISDAVSASWPGPLSDRPTGIVREPDHPLRLHNRIEEISSMATKKSSNKKSSATTAANAAVEPTLHQQTSRTTQRYGEVIPMPHGLDAKAAKSSIDSLNQVLADSITLRDMYKKHHWQVVGPTFNQLHLLYDEHFTQQVAVVDVIAERIQLLGGISLAMAADVAEETNIPRAPRGREPASAQLSRLIDAHTLILKECRDYADKADKVGDDGTNDLLVSDVLRVNELQVWFLSEHLVAATPL
jgi:starvation-inducible DNA-binding protein